MNRSTFVLSIATLSLMIAPAFAQSDSNAWSASPSSMQTTDMQTPRGMREAMRMVPARASLVKTLDTMKAMPGSQFRATLNDNVTLDNGTRLARGTMLLGEVANDDMNLGGSARIALRFTQAVLKNGATVPIKATIVGLYSPAQLSDDDEGFMSQQLPNTWTDGTLQVDQIGVMSGVDLHSKIASRNSGVLVSYKGNHVKIPGGSELQLAIAARNPRDFSTQSGS